MASILGYKSSSPLFGNHCKCFQAILPRRRSRSWLVKSQCICHTPLGERDHGQKLSPECLQLSASASAIISVTFPLHIDPISYHGEELLETDPWPPDEGSSCSVLVIYGGRVSGRDGLIAQSVTWLTDC